MTPPPGKLIGDLEFLRKLAVAKFLLVDDNRNMVKTIENMLVSICSFKRKSQSIFRAFNGRDAIQVMVEQASIKNGYIDFIFLDWNMPMVPGIDVLRAIRGSKNPAISNVPILMITGEMRDKDVRDAVYEGVDGYLIKPFLENDIRGKMNPVIRSFWSKHALSRAENKRAEVRYLVGKLGIRVDVEFVGGKKGMHTLFDVSKHGARLIVGDEDLREVESISFADFAKPEHLIYKLKVASCPAIVTEGSKEVYIPLNLWESFKGEEAHNKWCEWVNKARAQEMDYRSQMA